MPTQTYTPLATVTLASTASSVTFSSIPATYRDLIVVASYSVTSAANSLIRVNGDSGANYNMVMMNGNDGGSPTGSTSYTGNEFYFSWSAAIPTNEIGTGVIQFLDYSATDKHKSGLIRHGSSREVTTFATRWANTTAISSISLTASATTYRVGSTFSLYGVIA